MTRSREVTENDVGEVNQLLTNLELNPSILDQVARLQELDLNQVTDLKRRVESELDKYTDMLANQNVDMYTSLVTADGYPRGDIDVLQIRLVRRNINMLRNDLNNIIERSFALLSTHFDHMNNLGRQNTGVLTAADNGSGSNLELKIPFALINEIDSNGPIAKAGVKNEDKLVMLGNVHAGNHMNLRSLQNEVIRNEDKELKLRILRNEGDLIDLILTPSRSWSGRGLLGCRLQEL